MAVFQIVLLLLLGGVALALIAPRLQVPWPALLALAGAGLAFVPGMPEITLSPDLALALFVAPVLLDAAYDTSLRDLRASWAPVFNLVLLAVVLTMAGVAGVARWIDPGMAWPVALTLGAIVAPPDAAAATAVLRQVRLPHRIMVILHGESLLNDATALLAYKGAVAAAMGAALGGWSGALLVAEAAGGLLAGHVLARLYMAATRRVAEGPEGVVLQFLGTFGVWLLADALELSAVLAVVAYAVTLARMAPGRLGARERRSAYAVWDVAVFVLNVLAFILVGLQLRGLVTRLEAGLWSAVGFAAAVLATTVVVRLAWVMSYNAAARWRPDWFGTRQGIDAPPPTWQGGLAIGWCGMRGVVTLAAALALPDAFPQRDLVMFAAFCVVLGTLVLQGMTLRPLLSRLTLPRDESVSAEAALARTEAARAALQALGADRGSEAGRLLEQEYQARIDADSGRSQDRTGLRTLRRRLLVAERACVADLRAGGRIGDYAFHEVEEELDWAEAELDATATD